MGGAFLALLGMTGQVMAADACARRDDRMAMRAAALQQELMVAALTCHAVPRYNEFVLSYQKQLRSSDNALKKYFVRTSGSQAAYHAFKTRLANQDSIRSIHDGNYCAEAATVFDAAHATKSLSALVMHTPVMMDADYTSCGDGGSDTMSASRE